MTALTEDERKMGSAQKEKLINQLATDAPMDSYTDVSVQFRNEH